ncbi:MAG TPA: ATP-binding protein [Stenomitos sp.]
MGPNVNSVQALAVLYDLAMTIGGEVSLEALLTKTLQRFLYHTGFPAGLIYSRPTPLGDGAWTTVHLEAVIGNYALIRSKGESLRLRSPLVGTTTEFAEAPEWLAAIPARRPYRYYLRLPIENVGAILLLSTERPPARLPLTEVFVPIMARLATAVRLCRSIEERTAALEQANQELESFSYSVSHDLRAPLRAIDGFSQILLEDYAASLDDEGRHMLATVRESTVRMGHLIEDILSFSRMGRQAMQTVPFDLAELAREVFEELRAATPDRRLRLVIQEVPPAYGDRALIRQVLVNLFSNALKFTQPRAEAEIRLSGACDGMENRYEVRDNGVGFDMRYADKLFGVFQRLHSEAEFEGTGIGLAIVKRIIGRHGGRVWAESDLGQGATFHFTLPRPDA